MSNGTRALNVTAEQLELLRVAVLHRMGKLEEYIANNRQFAAHGATAEAREAAGERLTSQLATLEECQQVLTLIDNT